MSDNEPRQHNCQTEETGKHYITMQMGISLKRAVRNNENTTNTKLRYCATKSYMIYSC